MPFKAVLFAVCFVLATGTTFLQAAHMVWSGLVIAENVPQPAPIPPELNKLEQTLKGLFGYNQFEVIGQSNNMLMPLREALLANYTYCRLHLHARGENSSVYTFNLK